MCVCARAGACVRASVYVRGIHYDLCIILRFYLHIFEDPANRGVRLTMTVMIIFILTGLYETKISSQCLTFHRCVHDDVHRGTCHISFLANFDYDGCAP